MSGFCGKETTFGYAKRESKILIERIVEEYACCEQNGDENQRKLLQHETESIVQTSAFVEHLIIKWMILKSIIRLVKMNHINKRLDCGGNFENHTKKSIAHN